MDSFDEVFSAIKEYCRARMVVATYNLFVEHLEVRSFDGKSVVLTTHADFIKNSLENRYMPLLNEAFTAVLGFSDLHIVIEVDTPAQPDVEQLIAPPVQNIGGNYAFTFENFIVGSTNKFAHAAAQAVAANPAGAYNPLFIYGPSGLGKTHLLNAIRLEIEKNHPEFKIIYIDGETFTNEIITAIRENSTSEFHQKYRNADVLLVDDIQFIGGKESTQEEFFHTFNTLYNAGKQIVLASDRPPKEIKSLEERLRTRFEWGLTADIQPPDFETRVAILRRKASLLNMDLPDDVAEYIANRLKNNIRQLEGAVKKLNAYRLLEGISPSIASAQNAIKDILSETQPIPVTVEKIISEAVRTYNVTADDVRGPKRTASISTARKVAMYCVRQITGMSMEEIGREFGNRDHSTVVYATSQVEKKMKNETAFRETIEDIIKNTKS